MYWLLSVSPRRWGWTRVGIPHQAFSGLIVAGSVNIWCTKRSGSFWYILFSNIVIHLVFYSHIYQKQKSLLKWKTVSIYYWMTNRWKWKVCLTKCLVPNLPSFTMEWITLKMSWIAQSSSTAFIHRYCLGSSRKLQTRDSLGPVIMLREVVWDSSTDPSSSGDGCASRRLWILNLSSHSSSH